MRFRTLGGVDSLAFPRLPSRLHESRLSPSSYELVIEGFARDLFRVYSLAGTEALSQDPFRAVYMGNAAMRSGRNALMLEVVARCGKRNGGKSPDELVDSSLSLRENDLLPKFPA